MYIDSTFLMHKKINLLAHYKNTSNATDITFFSLENPQRGIEIIANYRVETPIKKAVFDPIIPTGHALLAITNDNRLCTISKNSNSPILTSLATLEPIVSAHGSINKISCSEYNPDLIILECQRINDVASVIIDRHGTILKTLAGSAIFNEHLSTLEAYQFLSKTKRPLSLELPDTLVSVEDISTLSEKMRLVCVAADTKVKAHDAAQTKIQKQTIRQALAFQAVTAKNKAIAFAQVMLRSQFSSRNGNTIS